MQSVSHLSMTNNEIIRVTKIFTFDMAHALHGYDGPCKNIHGHTYTLSVTIKGKVRQDDTDPENGMVLDFSYLKKVVKEMILDVFDHALVLNGRVDSAKGLLQQLQQQYQKVILLQEQPTCENLMRHFLYLLQPFFTDHLNLVYLKLVETPTSYAEWLAEDNL